MGANRVAWSRSSSAWVSASFAFFTLAVAAATLVVWPPWLLRAELVAEEAPDEDPADEEPVEREFEEFVAWLLDVVDLDVVDLDEGGAEEFDGDVVGRGDGGSAVEVLLGLGDGLVVGGVEASSLAAVVSAWTAMASDSCSSTTPCWACCALSSDAVQASRS